jgi:hypothetical protein
LNGFKDVPFGEITLKESLLSMIFPWKLMSTSALPGGLFFERLSGFLLDLPGETIQKVNKIKIDIEIFVNLQTSIFINYRQACKMFGTFDHLFT